MEKGWISLNRQIQEHWLWKDKPYDKARAWIDLLLLANYEDKRMPYKGEVITCKRGDVNLSYSFLAKRWGWSRKKVLSFIKLLENDEMVTTKATTHRTTITIVNYGFFQDKGTTKGTTKCTARVTTEEQQAHTTNKDNKDNNINNKVFMPPTVDEVKAYCRERNNNIDAQAFVSFYESKGWMIGKNKMKNWQAAVRTWEQKDKQSAKPKGNAFTERIGEKQNYNFDELERILTQ